MNFRNKKNRRLFSSLLGALLCSLNSNVSSSIQRPDLTRDHGIFGDLDDDDGFLDDSGQEQDFDIDLKTLMKWLTWGLLGLAANKKFDLLDNSITDDISSGVQLCVGYNGVASLANVLGLSYSKVAEAVSLGGKQLDAKWGEELGKLAKELSDDNDANGIAGNTGWVTTVDGLSTYWKLACSVKTDLNLEFGKNTGAVLKKLISNRSYLGTPLVVDKEKILDNDGLVKPFTEDGGFKKDGLTTFKGGSSDYWFAGTREFLVNAKNSRESLFSINSAMLQTYHLFYQRQMWETQRCGKFNIEGNPLPLDNGTLKCIYEDKKPTVHAVGADDYENKGKWAWKTDSYVYVRVPSNNGTGTNSTWLSVHNGTGCDIPIYSNAPDHTFVDSLMSGDKTLKTWLGRSNDFDSKLGTNPNCRYIAIPL